MIRDYRTVVLPYGERTVQLDIPSKNLQAVVSPREVSSRADLATQLRGALRRPEGVRPFSEALGKGDHLLLLIDSP